MSLHELEYRIDDHQRAPMWNEVIAPVREHMLAARRQAHQLALHRLPVVLQLDRREPFRETCVWREYKTNPLDELTRAKDFINESLRQQSICLFHSLRRRTRR
jgi:hypothetical protein